MIHWGITVVATAVFAVAASVSVCVSAFAAPRLASPFDKPVSTQKIPAKPGGNGLDLHCTYYADFMVRELHEGPSSQDAVIVRGARPRCSAAKVPGEIALKTADHSLSGRKGPFLIFSAMDSNGSVPFVVVDVASGRTLHTDATYGNPEFQELELGGDGMRLRYMRGINAECSIMQDARGCWAKLVAAKIIPATMAQQVPSPQVCNASYQKAKSPRDNPSIVSYRTDVRVDAKAPVQVISTGPVLCDPRP
jgi:hypothetical protein